MFVIVDHLSISKKEDSQLQPTTQDLFPSLFSFCSSFFLMLTCSRGKMTSWIAYHKASWLPSFHNYQHKSVLCTLRVWEKKKKKERNIFWNSFTNKKGTMEKRMQKPNRKESEVFYREFHSLYLNKRSFFYIQHVILCYFCHGLWLLDPGFSVLGMIKGIFDTF